MEICEKLEEAKFLIYCLNIRKCLEGGRTAESLINDYEVQYGQLNLTHKLRVVRRVNKFITLLILDVFFCFFIIGPAVIAFWRGTWDFTVYLLDEAEVDRYLSNFISLTVGFTATLLIDLFHSNLGDILGNPGDLKHTLATRIYSVLWGITDIMLWKGVWDGLDLVAGIHWQVSLSSLSVGVIILSVTRTLKSALSMPIGICVDEPSEHLSSQTFLETDKSDPIFRRLCDGFVSRLLEICVVLTWHGAWSFIDIASDELGWSSGFSGLVCLLVGFLGIIFIFLIQFILINTASSNNKMADSSPSVCWHIFNYIFTLVGIFITIASFRGVWYTLDNYYVTDNKYASYMSATVIGYLILLAFGCSSCLHAGIYKDDPSLGVSVTFYYFSHKYVVSLGRTSSKTGLNGVSEIKDLLNMDPENLETKPRLETGGTGISSQS
ncbi:uncharacterized protein LOC111706445 [Eurytemora carolleeae]|uniref:uncharacterized protein LOC111706445 n=1 Tax=Eurytemora carolleeae TaxID=1294199 RepID=UPI000C7576DB|nr:uncharacterized protein LOC111706445 [Eurytemora carolleeae]|eukprot:XP_023335090.1 uncharacterized protein LOC111706445 [Eurytemora affinis]